MPIIVLSESLGMSGFEKGYSLFGVTNCMGEYSSFVLPGRLLLDGLAFFVFNWNINNPGMK